MAAKGKCIYGVNEPTSINQLNRAYMTAFLKEKLSAGEITREQIAEYKKKKNAAIKKVGTLTPIEKSRIERKQFVDMFMPELERKKAIKVDFDAELDALIKE